MARPLVAAELSELPPGHAIELGCGEGRQALWLAARGWRATAVDFSPVAIDRGRRLRPGGTLFVLGWDRDNATGPAPRYSVAELTAAAGGLAVVRAERVRQAGSASAWDTLLVARNSGEMA